MNTKIANFIFVTFSISFSVLILAVISIYFFEAKDIITKDKIRQYETIVDDFEYTINLNIKGIISPIITINDIINSTERQEIKRKHISSIMATTPSIKRILIIDSKDKVIDNYPFIDDLIGIDFSNNEILREIRSIKNKPIVIGPHVCLIDKAPHYIIPIEYSNHLLLAYLDMDWIKPFIDKFSRTGIFVFTVDDKGTFTTHVEQNLAEESMNVKNIPVIKRALAGQRGPFIEVFDGQTYLVYAKKLEILNWVIFVGERYDKAYLLMNYIKNKGVVIFLGAVFTCLILSLIISRMIQSPINILIREIDKIKKGDYDVTLLNEGFEEIKEISKSLCKMSNEIRDREYRFKKIFEDSKNSIILSSENGTIIDANKACLDLFGFSERDMIIGTNIINLFSNHDDFNGLKRDIKEQGYISNIEVGLIRHNHEPFYGLLSCSILRYSGISDDIYMYLIIDLT
ncbi:MAG: PAS domain-containing protein, partial [Thermodesulfovibrionales bacterium]